MDKERFLQSGLLEQYVLGLTTNEESEEVERYAQTFPDVRAEIDQLRNALRRYAEQEIAAPEFKKRKSQLNNKNVIASSTPPPTSTRVGKWLVAASLLVLGLSGIYYHQEARQAQQQVSQLSNDFQAFRTACEKEQENLQEVQRQLAFYHHQRTNPLQLTGTNLAPACKVRVYWNEQEKVALLQVLSLPTQPQSNQYQIWADIEGKMVDLGLIDAHSDQPQPILCLPKASSLNITLEPLGGSTTPHVDQLYANVNLR